MYGYYGFDWTYVVLVLPCILLSLWASANVNSTFKRYSTQYSRLRQTLWFPCSFLYRWK